MRMQPLEPRRVRYPRGAYGWVDLAVITGGYIERLGSKAALTYLFLCSVGNTQGLSCWSRRRLSQVLGLSPDDVDGAFLKLTAADLVATNGRVVQILPLETTGPCRGGRSLAPDVERPAPVCAIAGDELSDAGIVTEVSEEEVRAQESEARRHLAKIQNAPRLETIRRVARSFALISKAAEPHSSKAVDGRG
jgi:hypothetical protein